MSVLDTVLYMCDNGKCGNILERTWEQEKVEEIALGLFAVNSGFNIKPFVAAWHCPCGLGNGWLRIGSEAWWAWVYADIDPMTLITEAVRDEYGRFFQEGA